MLLVDERIGSKDLLTPLQRYGVPAELARLEFADFAFVGRGVGNTDITIGIELKETRDLISSLQSSRFAGHQLPGLITTYDRVWLLTEGIWRAGDGDVLEALMGGWRTVSVGRRRIMANDLESWLLSIIIRGGINYWHCQTRRDTVRFLSVLYRFWTVKALDEHKSTRVMYSPPLRQHPDRATFVEPTPFQKGISGLIEGIGWEKSEALEKHFKSSFQALTLATAKDLQDVPGIGKTLANRIAVAVQ